jgi:transcriptional regulator with XRE-family HTH domain
MPTVAEMLEEGMRRKNMSQQRLARETGITAPWINMILRRGRAPGPSALLRIAEVLGIDKRRLVRQAHYERAYDEWKRFLERDEEGPETPSAGAGMVPVVGRMTTAKALPDREGARGARQPEAEVVRTSVGPDLPGLRENGTDETADAPGAYPGMARQAPGSAEGPPGAPVRGGARRFVGFDPECMAIRVEGDGLEPVAYDGQYVVVSPNIPKESVPDGAIVYVTYELPGETASRAMIRRMYRYQLAGEEGGPRAGLPIYNFVPVNTRLRMKGREPESEGAITLRHRCVREMYPVVGVVFGTRG